MYDDRGNAVTVPTLIKSEIYWALSFLEILQKQHLYQHDELLLSLYRQKIMVESVAMVSKIVSSNTTIPWLWKVKVEESIIPKWNINGLYLNMMGTSWGDITSDNTNTNNLIPNIFVDSDKLLVSTTQLSDPNKIKTTILQILNDGTTIGKQANDWIIIKRNENIVAQNILLQQEVILWQASNFSRSNTLNDSSVEYSRNTNIITTLWWSAGSTNSDKIISLIDRSSIYKPNKISSIEDSVDSNKNIGWRHSQEHLTQFGQGKSVWESTMTNASWISY